MKKLLLVLAALLLSGCATTPVPVKVAGLERSEQVRVQDLRPATEKQGEVFSVMITSDAYAIYRVAEDFSAPSAIRLLQHRAYEKLAKGTETMELKVRHLVVYRNQQSELRRMGVAAGLGGAIGAAIAASTVRDASGITSSVVDPGAFDALASTEFKRAYFTEQENPGRAGVHVIYIDTELAGKRVLTRTLAPARAKEGDANPIQTAFVNGLEAAIQYHLAQH